MDEPVRRLRLEAAYRCLRISILTRTVALRATCVMGRRPSARRLRGRGEGPLTSDHFAALLLRFRRRYPCPGGTLGCTGSRFGSSGPQIDRVAWGHSEGGEGEDGGERAGLPAPPEPSRTSQLHWNHCPIRVPVPGTVLGRETFIFIFFPQVGRSQKPLPTLSSRDSSLE